MSIEEAEDLLQKSVRIAREERDRFWKEYQNKVLTGTARAGSRQRALVAASIGSYGAYLADGSEYRYATVFSFSLDVGKIRFSHLVHFQVVRTIINIFWNDNDSYICSLFCEDAVSSLLKWTRAQIETAEGLES